MSAAPASPKAAAPTAPAPPGSHQKALAINLDATSFGTFAEIGAGQEVARWFLSVGAASGTVAKTISAYDKEVSDDLYGAGTRYVSKQRLIAMLDREWKLLLAELDKDRGAKTRFFTLADTVSARNFAGTNDCHGWMGVRFQHQPQSKPSDFILHVNMRDPTNAQQAECLGILGVNLLYALMNEHATNPAIVAMLFDNITEGRIEIDFVEASGPAFGSWDTATTHVDLVRNGCAEAVAFQTDGTPIPGNELLYKKPVVAAPATAITADDIGHDALMQCAGRAQKTLDKDAGEVLPLYVILATGSVAEDAAATPMSTSDLVGLVERLRARGCAVMIERSRELYRSTAFIRRYTQAPVYFAASLRLLALLFDDARYEGLEGRMLEGLARLFAQNVKAFALPAPRADLARSLSTQAHLKWTTAGSGEWVTAQQLKPPPPIDHLYEYLLATGFLVPIAVNTS